MSLTDQQLRHAAEIVFNTYDVNKDGFLELREVTQLINLTLSKNKIGRKFKMSEAK